MIRVLFLMTAREVGGAELYVERLVEVLQPECQFTIVLSDHPNLSGLKSRLGNLARVEPFRFDRPASLVQASRVARRLAANQDIVHLNSNHPGSRWGIALGFALRGLDTPVVTVEHRATLLSDIKVPKGLEWCLPALFRWSRRGVARVVAVSEENARVLVENYGLPASRIQVVHNGVDLSLYQRGGRNGQSLRNELGLEANQPIILVLARLVPNKGHRYLIEAAPKILSAFPDAHFVFAGSPDNQAPLESLIADANLTHKFSILGHRTDVVGLLQSSDLFVLPSLGEGFALSIIEAMASGLGVIATRVGGAAEIVVDGKNGFLVPPGDASALSRAVNDYLSRGPAEREALREAARTRALQFSIQAKAREMLEIYQDVGTFGRNKSRKKE